MEKRVKLSAILVASQLDLKGIKAMVELKPTSDSSTELLYTLNQDNDQYTYYFNYGVIVFSGQTEDEISKAVAAIQPFARNPVASGSRDDHQILLDPAGNLEFDFDKVIVNHLDSIVVRIAMLNVAQSVALDRYHEVSETLLTEIKGFTRDLESSGRLSISRRNMMKFIGKALNTKIDIAENIYIFDAPDLTWDDEFSDKLHQGLIKHFDLRVRYSEIEYTLKIIEDNLSIFREISNQARSNMLEIIIIALILVEVVNLFISELFRNP